VVASATPTAPPECTRLLVTSSDVPKALLDPGTITSTLVIPSGPIIGSVEVVGLNIAHTFPGDLRAYLTSPEGTRIELFVAVCGGDDWTASNTGFTLSDGASSEIGAACPPLWLPYRPSGRLAPLAGERSNGTWVLEVIDAGAGDTGTLNGWGLRINSGPCPVVTPCAVLFDDVPPSQPFYSYIRCLACQGILSGYSDGTFRPGANVTRGQLSKIIANAAGFADPIPASQQTFEDVPGGANPQPFWLWIERLYAHGAISGYQCGGAGEPCGVGNRPYFRPGANATRGQIAKIDAIAAQMTDPVPSGQETFQDVPPTNAFWRWIEQLAGRGIISGYTCGGAGEPCVPPANRPYFRWGANTTRGQMAKIAANTFYPNCQVPARP
jgi:subtilisin-like proprotein convertase family protein